MFYIFQTEKANVFFLCRLKNLYGYRLVFEFLYWVFDFPLSFFLFHFFHFLIFCGTGEIKKFDCFSATCHSCMLELLALGSHTISVDKVWLSCRPPCIFGQGRWWCSTIHSIRIQRCWLLLRNVVCNFVIWRFEWPTFLCKCCDFTSK